MIELGALLALVDHLARAANGLAVEPKSDRTFDSLHDQWIHALRSPDGTLLAAPAELARFERQDTLESLFGSGKVADEFNVANKVYAQPQPVAAYIDGSLSKEALVKEPLAKEAAPK